MNTHRRSDLRTFKVFRHRMLAAVVPAVLLIATACSGSSSSSPPGGVPPAAATDWLQANHDFANTPAAIESPISSTNVDQLGVGWTFAVDGASAYGSLATSPIVVDGTVYLQDLKSNVFAIDLASGELMWQKRYDTAVLGPNGPAFDQGMLFVTDGMQTVAALDATTGEQLWSKRIAPPATQGITQQLTAWPGTLYLSTVPGTSPTRFYPGGGLGVIHALDERTGDVLWSFDTVKGGQLWGNTKVNSGGGAWYPPAIDTSTGTTFWGIGNPAPL